MSEQWLSILRQVSRTTPLVILCFAPGDWRALRASRKGINEFTITRSHLAFGDVHPPCLCIMHGQGSDERLYLGLIKSRAAVATLDTRIKVARGVEIAPSSIEKLIGLVPSPVHADALWDKVKARDEVVIVRPALGTPVVDALTAIPENRGPIRSVIAGLSGPKRFSSNEALQEDGIRTALKAFGLGMDDRAASLELVEAQETGLARVGVLEDAVVEHQARSVPGFQLMKSDVTGRAVFIKGDERLEVFTANDRPLEKVFGVDLIYLNRTRGNIVMLQYKMLDYVGSSGKSDWIYRPDDQLELELRRMRRFTTMHESGTNEYRLNPAVFFMKFVKRHGELSKGGIITPLDHFEVICGDPNLSRGPKDGFRISYNSLNGRYLRETPFLDLVRAGYIGGRSETTRHLELLVRTVVRNNRAVVGAIQQALK